MAPATAAGSWWCGSGAVAAESVLARLQRLVDDAQRDKAPLQRIADRISAVFVPAVLVGAALTFLVWWLVVGNLGPGGAERPGRAAGGLPLRHGPGRAGGHDGRLRPGRGARHLHPQRRRPRAPGQGGPGGLRQDRNPHRAARRGHRWSPRSPAPPTDEVLSLAAAVEAESEHPIATAIVAAAGPAGLPPAARGAVASPGSGVVGMVGGRAGRGRADGPGRAPRPRSAAPVAERSERGETVVAVERDGEVVGVIALTTPLRPEAGPAVAHLRRWGSPSAILSGDSEPAVRTVAAELGIDDGPRAA